MKKQSVEKVRYCECLDYVEASHRHRVYPLMYCHIRLSGHLDIDHLKYAVFQSAKIVPEIMLAFDFKSGCFINLGHIVDHIIMTLSLIHI